MFDLQTYCIMCLSWSVLFLEVCLQQDDIMLARVSKCLFFLMWKGLTNLNVILCRRGRTNLLCIKSSVSNVVPEQAQQV